MRKKYRKKKIKGIPFFYGYSFNGISNCKNCDVDRKTMVVPHPVEDQGVACVNCGNPVLGIPSAVSESKDMKLLKEYNPMKAVFHFTPQNSKEITAYSDVSIENAISTLENVKKYIKIPELDKMIKCLTEIQSYGDAYESMSFLQMQNLKEAIRSFLDEVYSSGNYFPGKSELEEVHTMIEVMMELAINQDMEKIDSLKKEMGSGSQLPMAAEGLQRQLKENFGSSIFINFSDSKDRKMAEEFMGTSIPDFLELLKRTGDRLSNKDVKILKKLYDKIENGDKFTERELRSYYVAMLNLEEYEKPEKPEESSDLNLLEDIERIMFCIIDMADELSRTNSDAIESEDEERHIDFSDINKIKEIEKRLNVSIEEIISLLKEVNVDFTLELASRISSGDVIYKKELRSYQIGIRIHSNMNNHRFDKIKDIVDKLAEDFSYKDFSFTAEGLQRQLKESVNFSDPEDINKIQQAIGGPMSDLIGLLRIVNNETTREIDERIVSGDVFSKDDFIRYYEILENQLSSAGFADPSTNELLGKEYYEKLSELVDYLQELVMISAEDEPEEMPESKEFQEEVSVEHTMKESKTVKIKENSLKKMITAFAKQALKESPEDFLQGQEFEEEAPRSMEIPPEEIVPAPEGVEGALQTAIDSLYSCYSNLSTEDMMKINDAIEMLEDIKERSRV